MNVPRAEKEYEEICLTIIEEQKEKLENIITTVKKERQERYRKVFEKICEIENVEDRTFTLLAFVSELERTLVVIGELIGDE